MIVIISHRYWADLIAISCVNFGNKVRFSETWPWWVLIEINCDLNYIS